MNCEDFKTIVNELAGGKLMDAKTREAGWGHVVICAGCAAQLNDAQTATMGLQIAGRAETEEAPARVKQALLAAFASQHKANAGQKEARLAAGSVIEISNVRRLPRWIAAATIAAAAVLLFVLFLPLWLGVSPEPPPQSANPAVTPLAARAPSPDNPRGEMTRATADKTAAGQKTSSTSFSIKRTSTIVRKPPRLSERVVKDEMVAKKISNDYFPLTYLADSTAMESGTVVRIELSRSALISLGLPMNAERADELVKADLVVGDDGVARAIRLVQ